MVSEETPPGENEPRAAPDSEAAAMPGRYQFSLRSLLIMVTCYAVLLGLAVIVYQGTKVKHIQPVGDRSWLSGSVTISVESREGETWVMAKGDFPEAKPTHYLRYGIWLIDEEGRRRGVQMGTGPGCSLGCSARMSNDTVNLQEPFRAVCDYEIWDGEPGKGELLCKNSVVSAPLQRERMERRQSSVRPSEITGDRGTSQE